MSVLRRRGRVRSPGAVRLLRALALNEKAQASVKCETCPQEVERAYHVGRRLAFEQAARIVEGKAGLEDGEPGIFGEREREGTQR